MKKMKRVFRCDSPMPWITDDVQYVTAEDAAHHMLDVGGGSEADRARQRMLERYKLHGESPSAAEARRRMVQKGNR